MNRDLKIKELLEEKKTIRQISELLNVNHKVVEKVKKQGRYYLDIKSGELIFSSNKVSFEEQAYNYLCFKYGVENGYLYSDSGSTIIDKRAVNPRLAVYLGVDSRQTNRWSKKDVRLFGCDEFGKPTDELEEYAEKFYDDEKNKFKETQYYIDENGMVKGYKLSYVSISEQHLFHVKRFALFYVEWRNQLRGEKENRRLFFSECKKKFGGDEKEMKFLYINTVLGIELGRWILKMLDKYNYKYIIDSINHACKPIWVWTEEDETKDVLHVPTTFYTNKKAYYSDLLSDEYKAMVREYMY